MAQRRALGIINGQTSEIPATDQILCDAGGMTLTETGGTQKTLPDAMAGKVNRSGDTMTGPLTVRAQAVLGDSTDRYPVATIFTESTQTANGSKRSCFNFGSGFQVGQDFSGNGTRDFYIYNVTNGSLPLRLATNDVTTFNNTPTVNGSPIYSANDNLAISKAINFRQKKFVLSDYNAIANDPNSASANANAAQAALNDIAGSAGGGTLVVPSETYFLNQGIGGQYNGGVQIEGAGPYSRLLFKNIPGNTAISLDGGVSGAYGAVRLKDLIVEADACSNLTNGSLIYARGSGTSGSILVSDVSLKGSSTARPSIFLNVINPMHSSLRNVSVEGNSGEAYGTQSIGINVSSDRKATELDISAAKVARVATGIKIMPSSGGANTATFEGISFTDCSVYGVQNGVDIGYGGYRAPGYTWKGGHINAQKFCMTIQKFAQFKIIGGEFYLDCNNGPQCHIRVMDSDTIQILNNTFNYIRQIPSQITPPNISSVVIGSGSTYIYVFGNEMLLGLAPNSQGIWAQSDAGIVRARDNARYGGGTNVLAGISGADYDLGGNKAF